MSRIKRFLKGLVLLVLKIAAKWQLKKMGGEVIGITGSVGKTSCKDFLFELLSTKYVTRRTPKSLNSESGVPLAILGQESGYSNPWLWLKVLFGIFITLLFDWRRVDFFVVEMGVDKPGDMDYLLSFISPSVAIFLGVVPVHTANFSDYADPLAAIYAEKRKLLLALPQNSVAVVNFADEFIRQDVELIDILNARQITVIKLGKEPPALHFPNVLGNGLIATLGMAAVLAQKLGVAQDNIQAVAATFKLTPGRMGLLPGIKETLIIDSSYNASKYPMLMALDVLASFTDRKKIAVLGDMRELGALAQTEHEEVARKAVKVADDLVLVGPIMRDYFVPEALKLGFPKERLRWFIDSTQAASFVVDSVVKGGEAILVKGSQNTIFLEKVVCALMLEKEKASELLCRQEPAWKGIKNNA